MHNRSSPAKLAELREAVGLRLSDNETAPSYGTRFEKNIRTNVIEGLPEVTK